MRKKKPPLHEAPEIWDLFVVAATLIILTNALPFNESGLSGQPSVAGGPLDPLLGLSQPHTWSSCLSDSLVQQPDFESTDKGGGTRAVSRQPPRSECLTPFALLLTITLRFGSAASPPRVVQGNLSRAPSPLPFARAHHRSVTRHSTEPLMCCQRPWKGGPPEPPTRPWKH